MLKKISKIPFSGTPEQEEKLNAVIAECNGDKSLLMLRDSFGVALAPFVTAHYGDSTVLHGSATTVDVLNEQLSSLPDMVVLEATERFSENLLSQARTLLAWLEQ